MRILFALPLLVLAVPAAARDRTPPPPDPTARALAALSDPRVQGAMVTVINRFSDVLLDTRVGPIAAIDPRADVRPNDTARDVLRRDDPAFDARLHDRTRGTVTTIGRAAGAANAFSTEIERTTRRLQGVLDGVVPDTQR